MASPLFGQIDSVTKNASDSIRTRIVMGLRGHVGSKLIHAQTINSLPGKLPWGVEADIARQYVNERAWDFCNCYSRMGGALTYWNYGHQALGHSLAAQFYLEPVFLTKNRLNLSFRLGGGLAYTSNPFDSTSNPFNLAYSTPINFAWVGGVGLQYRLTPHWGVRLATAFHHKSNASVKFPNKGLNFPTVGLGVDYAPQAIDFKERAMRQDRRPLNPRLRLYAGVAGTWKNAPGSTQKGVFGAWATGVYYVGRWSGLNLGVEWIDDGARRLKMELDTLPGHPGRGAVLVGHQFLMGRLVFSQQLGVYVFDQYRVNDPVFQRIGLGLHVTKRLYAGVSIKSHRHLVDLAEIRLGYGIWKDPKQD